MQNEPEWLTGQDIIEINVDQVSLTGENHSLLSEANLETAIASPRNRFHYGGEEDVLRLATRLLFAIAKLHPFEQGNKRTGLVAFAEFLAVNGYAFEYPDGDDLSNLIVAVIEGAFNEEDFVAAVEASVLALEED